MNTAAALAVSTLARTPVTSTAQATGKAVKTPIRRPRADHKATEGHPARPTAIHAKASRCRTSGDFLTIATRNVAVIT